MNKEPWQPRLILHKIDSGRESLFRDRVCERDDRCVVSGIVNRGAKGGCWVGFEAAHVFPRGCESHWRENGFDTVFGSYDTAVNSVQNGFILNSCVQGLWNQYLISVDPDVSIQLTQYRGSTC